MHENKSIKFPDKETLKTWTGFLKEDAGSYFYDDLPHIDGTWYEQIIKTIELIQLSHYPNDLHQKGAHLFYKIVKNHHFTDGNKRSAIIIVNLYYIMNGYVILKRPDELRELAQDTAKSSGQESESEIQILSKTLSAISIKIQDLQ